MRWRKFNGENIILPIKDAVEEAIKKEASAGTKLKVCIARTVRLKAPIQNLQPLLFF